MQIIESTYELQTFKDNIQGKVSYWYPMWVDDTLHPQHTQLSFVFVRSDSDYILPIAHGDCNNLNINDLESCFDVDGDKWVFHRKRLLQSLKTKNTLDVEVSYFTQTSKPIDYRTPFETLYQKWKVKGYYDNLNQSIPILKLGEVIQGIIPHYQKLDKQDKTFKWYNDVYIPILSEIERYGIRVEPTKFIDRWPASQKHIHINKVHTEYNPFTVTGRPSNRHGGVNFSALNKKDGSRECFISNGMFLQMDYDAYHPRIIGKLIGYELPKTSVHQWLSEQYGCEYEESKSITFQLLYGGIPDEFLEIPYYKGVKEYIEDLWEKVKVKGYLQTPNRRIPLEWIEDPNPQKVFNYLLQATETELNVEVMGRILEIIKGSGILFSLYTYDSFLLDVPTDVDKRTIGKLKEEIESFGFPIKASWGMDYSKV